jgi:hypothetical protein
MKKLIAILISILILLALVDPFSPKEEEPGFISRNITAKVLEIDDSKLYVEILTGLHLDKAFIKTTSSSAIWESLDGISPNDIIVISVAEIETRDDSVLLTADYVSLPGN